jgi:UDP-N-acetylmuramoylalanine--D-glutamate ligase
MGISHCIKSGGSFYLEERCFLEYSHLLHREKALRYGYSKECKVSTDLKGLFFNKKLVFPLPISYQGRKSHDLENILAAYALCRHVGVEDELFLAALATFKKPLHRLQFVTEIDGIKYIDDSKGTNLDAVIRAVEMTSAPIVLIAGGVDKGAAYTPWIQGFAQKVKSICAIGQAKDKIKRDLGHAIPVHCFETLQEAVIYASVEAKPSGSVLLAPGCASFDMFRDYAHRGEEFQRIVLRLGANKSVGAR